MSTFGRVWRVTTFGESHGAGVGAVVDGVPAGIELDTKVIQAQLDRRRPGQSMLTTARAERDVVEVLSGLDKGKTLGTPIAMLVRNEDTRPADYAGMAGVPRPGHADYSWGIKYGVVASSGGGRASARETVGRVAAGAVAEAWLKPTFGTNIVAWVSAVGNIELPANAQDELEGPVWSREDIDRLGTLKLIRNNRWPTTAEAQAAADEAAFVAEPEDCKDPAYQDLAGVVYDRQGNPCALDEGFQVSELMACVRCPNPSYAAKMATLIRYVRASKDSIGGVVTCVCTGVPAGLGEPVFDKLPAMLAHAMMSIPATKGFEFGSGFAGTKLRGSQHNDAFVGRAADQTARVFGHSDAKDAEDAKPLPPLLATASNHAGGTLGGVTTGNQVLFRVAIKPVSTIGIEQVTCTYGGDAAVLAAKGRHDSCVLPRAVPIVECMAALVFADAAMLQAARFP